MCILLWLFISITSGIIWLIISCNQHSFYVDVTSSNYFLIWLPCPSWIHWLIHICLLSCHVPPQNTYRCSNSWPQLTFLLSWVIFQWHWPWPSHIYRLQFSGPYYLCRDSWDIDVEMLKLMSLTCAQISLIGQFIIFGWNLGSIYEDITIGYKCLWAWGLLWCDQGLICFQYGLKVLYVCISIQHKHVSWGCSIKSM